MRQVMSHRALAETEYKVNQQILLNPTYNSTSGETDVYTSLNLNRHGVRIVAVILGS